MRALRERKERALRERKESVKRERKESVKRERVERIQESGFSRLERCCSLTPKPKKSLNEDQTRQVRQATSTTVINVTTYQ